jgi:hypothetical protein
VRPGQAAGATTYASISPLRGSSGGALEGAPATSLEELNRAKEHPVGAGHRRSGTGPAEAGAGSNRGRSLRRVARGASCVVPSRELCWYRLDHPSDRDRERARLAGCRPGREKPAHGAVGGVNPRAPHAAVGFDVNTCAETNRYCLPTRVGKRRERGDQKLEQGGDEPAESSEARVRGHLPMMISPAEDLSMQRWRRGGLNCQRDSLH